mmetsp:Transcript_87045/g.246769  ORF Transcript_87045/g.246769 Transcript_87045/m.246769 type:complete len:429 (-) Transcript_87045:99-1385(-)
MEDLFRIGEAVSKDGVVDPTAFAGALAADPALADLLASGGDIEQYLQNYEQMLESSCQYGNGVPLNQVDAEGGVTVRPDPGFVVKTKDMASGMKIFINIVSNENVEKPHMKSFTEMDGEEGCRVPLSVGTAVEDFDKKSEPCVTYDIVANPDIVQECAQTPAFREQVVQLCLASLAQKYKIELDPRYKLPKMKYKGSQVQLQRIRKKGASKIEEMPGGTSGAGAEAGGEARSGVQPPSFCLYYAQPGAPAIDGLAAEWPPPAEDFDAAGAPHLCGLDLPCYRVSDFQENIRGTMKNQAGKEEPGGADAPEDQEANCPGRRAERETRDALAGRTCVVQVHMPDLDKHVATLKQFRAEVSDECLRVSFPPLPRSDRAMYAPLTVWWPHHFCSAQADAEWDAGADTLVVTLPTEAPAEAKAFDPELLDAVF